VSIRFVAQCLIILVPLIVLRLLSAPVSVARFVLVFIFLAQIAAVCTILSLFAILSLLCVFVVFIAAKVKIQVFRGFLKRVFIRRGA
jgi:hypothetical protein